MLSPYTESEEMLFSSPAKIYPGEFPPTRESRAPIPYVYWICYCGAKCSIVEKALKQGTKGGYCVCNRSWLIAIVKDTDELIAFTVESSQPVANLIQDYSSKVPKDRRRA